MSIILSINNNLDQSLRELGHTVISIRLTDSGVYSVKSLWEGCEIYPQLPDFFIQKESLGAKIFFLDVHHLPCKKAFWGIDTHLHYGWQMYYTQLFDTFLTPHKAFLAYLCEEWQHPQLFRLAQSGTKRSFIPHAERKHKLNFVGRLSGTRAHRQRVCALLRSRYNMEHLDGLTFAQMMDLYDNTCIIPNESIANEVNFRLMEAASAGACVISPHVGDDQDSLFTPGEEVLIYKNLNDLERLIDNCLADPIMCENIGKKAFARVQKEHTPLRRAQELMDAVTQESTSCSSEAYADDIAHLSLFLATQSTVTNISMPKNVQEYSYTIPALSLLHELFSLLKAVKGDKAGSKEKVFVLLDRASLCLMQQKSQKITLCTHTQARLQEHEKTLAIACGGAALYYEDAALGYFFLRLHQKLCGLGTPPVPQESQTQDAVMEMGLLWVHILIHLGKECFKGETYTDGCCRTAFDFVTVLRKLYPTDMRWFAATSLLKNLWKSYPQEEREQLENTLYV